MGDFELLCYGLTCPNSPVVDCAWVSGTVFALDNSNSIITSSCVAMQS